MYHICVRHTFYIPKLLIRGNANFIVLFKEDKTNLRHIYFDQVNTHMSFDVFKQTCSSVWYQSSNSIVVIDRVRRTKDAIEVWFDKYDYHW